jgi:hypothetical protein
VWKPNDTIALNYDSGSFVFHHSPGAEMTHYGGKALLCEKGGNHLSFNDIDRITAELIADTSHTIRPGAKALDSPHELKLSDAIRDKRQRWLQIIESAEGRIRSALAKI